MIKISDVEHHHGIYLQTAALSKEVITLATVMQSSKIAV